jgi:hypothetical protein
MGDDGRTLEPVGRSGLPALWIGGWVVGLAVVVALAVAGRGAPVDDLAAVPPVRPAASEAPVTPAAPAALASPGIPDAVPRVIRPRAARAPARPSPTLGDDGLVGGTSYSSAAPAD